MWYTNARNWLEEKSGSELLIPVNVASLTLLALEPQVIYPQGSSKGCSAVPTKASRIWCVQLTDRASAVPMET